MNSFSILQSQSPWEILFKLTNLTVFLKIYSDFIFKKWSIWHIIHWGDKNHGIAICKYVGGSSVAYKLYKSSLSGQDIFLFRCFVWEDWSSYYGHTTKINGFRTFGNRFLHFGDRNGIQYSGIHSVKGLSKMPKFRHNLPSWTTQWSTIGIFWTRPETSRWTC